MALAAPNALVDACALPYTVRNTFIDVESSPIAGAESIFNTWPGVMSYVSIGDNDVQDGELPSTEEQALPSSADGLLLERREVGRTHPFERHVDLQPVADEGEHSSLEDGELPEDQYGEVEEGEEYEEEEEDDEGQVVEREVRQDREALLEAAGASSRTAHSSQASLGSRDHALGRCRPCAWMYKSEAGCRNGRKCEYCHICPPGELKRRKKAKMQMRLTTASRQKTQNDEVNDMVSTTPSHTLTRAIVAKDMEPCYIEVPSLTKATLPTSFGSIVHASGQCRPCAWVHKDQCRNGTNCNYCHLCPPGELKRRKRKKWEAQQKMETVQEQ